MRVFKDERGYTITEQELKTEYEELRRNDETDAATFEQYVRNCTDKNGTLMLID